MNLWDEKLSEKKLTHVVSMITHKVSYPWLHYHNLTIKFTSHLMFSQILKSSKISLFNEILTNLKRRFTITTRTNDI